MHCRLFSANGPRFSLASARRVATPTLPPSRNVLGVSKPVVLIVEDDEVIGTELKTAIGSAGYDATWVTTGGSALAAAAKQPPDLILLDLGLPDIDGVTLGRRLRELVPLAVIVVLTARTAEFEVIVALDAGVDDYLTKPFRLAELLARLRAHLRRRTAPDDRTTVQEGRLRLDLVARKAWVDHEEMPLRPREFDLLAILASNAGQAVSRADLMSQVWDEHWSGPTKTLDVHVSALRRKLSELGEPYERIATLRGHGYRYEAPSK